MKSAAGYIGNMADVASETFMGRPVNYKLRVHLSPSLTLDGSYLLTHVTQICVVFIHAAFLSDRLKKTEMHFTARAASPDSVCVCC